MPDTPATRAILEAAAGLSRRICIDCQSLDGMEIWAPWEVARLMEPNAPYEVPPLYRRHNTNKAIFATCQHCNAGDHIPDGYVALDAKQVRRWLEAQKERCDG